MIIHKILNNNVAIVVGENKNEKIVMGRGICYHKKPGDEIDKQQIDKEFHLANQLLSDRFSELLRDIPFEYIEFVDDVIIYAKSRLGRRLNDTIFVSLSDHIYTAVTRAKEGILVRNALLWDIKRFYQDEYYIGQRIVEKIKDSFHIELTDDEAGFIALHIVNAQMDEGNNDMYEITEVMQEISNIVKYVFNVEFDEESVYYYRFITHLKFFAQRLLMNKTYEDDSDDDLLNIIQVKYQNSYLCVLKIRDFIVKKYSYDLSNEEILYLTIHIERVIYKKST